MSTDLQWPVGMVNQGWTRFESLGNDAIAAANAITEALQNFIVDQIPVNSDFIGLDLLNSGLVYKKPDPPEWDLNDIEKFDPGTSPSLGELMDHGFKFSDTIGDNKAQWYTPDLEQDKPDPLDIDLPKFDKKDLEDVNLPTKPDISNLDMPDELTANDFEQLDLPDRIPEIDIIRLEDIELPDTGRTLLDNFPDETIDWVHQDYDPVVLDELTREIKRMLDTGTGMPAVVEQMLVDTARAREDAEAGRAVQEAMERWASKGFTLPSGVVNKQITQARQNNQNQANTLNREVFVRRRQEEMENFRFAIAQGIALENLLIQNYNSVADRALRFAIANTELAFKVLDARIQIYNADVQAFGMRAQILRTLIAAESEKLNRYRLQIEAEDIKNRINQAKIANYKAQLDAVNTLISSYTAQVEAVNAVTQANQQKIDIFRAEIQGYAAQVQAKAGEYSNFKAEIDIELAKATRYEQETRAYMADIAAYEAKLGAATKKPEFIMRTNQEKLQKFSAEIQEFGAKLQKETSRWQAQAQAFSAESSMYVAEGQMAKFDSDVRFQAFQSGVEQNRFNAQHTLAKAQAEIGQVTQQAQILSSTLDAAGRIQSQLASGAMSAINLSAGMDQSWSSTYSYQM